MYHHHRRGVGDIGNGHQLFERVVRHVLGKEVEDVIVHGADEQRVPVGLRLGNAVEAYAAVAAGATFHHYRLTQRFGEFLRQGSRQHVNGAAR